MATVDAGFGSYLKSPARYTTAVISGSASTWGAKAVDTTITTPIAFKADADAEAVRQAQFLAGPIAKDVHVVPGRWAGLIGQIVTLRNNRLGYAGGVDVFVIGVQENETSNTTILTVLKRA